MTHLNRRRHRHNAQPLGPNLSGLTWMIAVGMWTTGPACIRPNQDFSAQEQGPQDDERDTQTSASSSDLVPGSTHTGDSIPSAADPDMSTTGEVESKSNYPTSPPVGTKTLGTTSQSTSSSSSTSSLPGLTRRLRIRVVNHALSTTIGTGYAIPIVFDHAALIKAGARPDGSDLAIVSVQPTHQALPRTLDPDSSWGQSQTKVWFSLPSPIAPGQTIDDQYVVLIGDKRFPGSDQPKRVFLTYDSFNGGTLDTSAWNVHASPEKGSSGQDVSHGQLRLWSRGQGLGSYSQIQSTSTWQEPGVRMEAQIAVRGGATSGLGDCSRERIIAAWSQQDNKVRGAVTQTKDRLYFESLRPPAINQIESTQGATLDTNTHRFVVDWEGPTQELYQDQSHLGSFTGRGIFKSPASTPMMLGFGTAAFGDLCEGVVSELVIDWVLARPFTSPEPTATLLLTY